jgi:tryptophan-rich sensory protein
MKANLWALPLWIVGALAAGWVGSIFVPGTWYATLVKPAWTPPNVIFGPVWTVLYVLMGTAAWLVWRRVGFAGAPAALGLFIVQLVLNALWSYLFFGAHRTLAAYIEILVLLVIIVATMLRFWRVSAPAGALLIPYAAWVTFASFLNLQIWRLNG